MGNIYIKQPVLFSFIEWIDSCGSLTEYEILEDHYSMERFYIFVKTVIRYKATRWERWDFFKEKVISIRPNFPMQFLDRCYSNFSDLLDFNKAKAVVTWTYKITAKNDDIEIRVVNDEVIMTVLKESTE